MTQNPRQQVRFVLLLTLALNLIVAAAKIIIGLGSGALAITADGFHSLVDGLSNVVGLIGNHYAARPPDADHPYGHRRFETLAALLIGAFLVLAAWEIMQGALERLQSGHQPTLSPLVFAVLIATLAFNIGISTYQIRAGKRLRSELLLADAANTRADVFVTLSVLVSMVLVAVTGWGWVDVAAALVVVVLIGRAAWRILHQTGRVLVDTAPYTPEALLDVLHAIPNVNRVARVRSRGTLDDAHVDVDLYVPPQMTADHTAAITQAVRQRLDDRLDGTLAEVEVHFIPDLAAPRDYALVVRAAADALGLATHEVRVTHCAAGCVMDLHVEVPPGQTLEAAHHLASQLERDIHAQLPEIGEVITHIEPAQPVTADEHASSDQQIKHQTLEMLHTFAPQVDWHHLRVFTQGDTLALTLHAALSPDATVEAAHQVAEQAEALLRAQMPQLDRVTIHTEPYDH